MRILLLATIFIILSIIDFVSKSYFDTHEWLSYYSIIGDYLGIQLSYNDGVAFSLPIK